MRNSAKAVKDLLKEHSNLFMITAGLEMFAKGKTQSNAA